MTDFRAKLEETYDTTIDRIRYDDYISKNLISSLDDLKSKVLLIYTSAPSFKHRGQVYNGYHSFVKINFNFLQVIVHNISHGHYDRLNNDIPVIARLLTTLADVYLRLIQSYETPATSIFSKLPDQLYELLEICTNKYEATLALIYGNYCAFWLCPSMRRVMIAIVTVMAAYASSSASSSFKCIWKSGHRGKLIAKLAHSASICFIKSFWGLAEYSLINEAVPSLFTRNFMPKIIKDFSVTNRQTKYTIFPSVDIIVKTPSDPETPENPKDEIKCRLLFERTDDISGANSVIIHCHGGGFVSQSPKSHEVYLRDWSKKLINVPIISIDYALSPEAHFPVALQQVLDVYLWLTQESNEAEITELLGFMPRRIVLVGDSAGGNLVIATCLTLNDIRTVYKDTSVRMPTAVMPIYAPLLLRPLSSPSRIFMAFDCLLPLGIMLSCLEAYIGIDEGEEFSKANDDTAGCSKQGTNDGEVAICGISSSVTKESKDLLEDPVKSDDEINSARLFKQARLNFLIEDRNDSSHLRDSNPNYANLDTPEDEFVLVDRSDAKTSNGETEFKFPSDFTFKFQRSYFSALGKIKKSIFGEQTTASLDACNWKPWYLDSEAALYHKTQILDQKASHPYVSPLEYTKYHSMSDIPVYIIAAEFDICLDDCIMLAEKWRGFKSLDVCEGLPHGFLNFAMLSEEAKQSSDLCVTRLKQTLWLPSKIE